MSTFDVREAKPAVSQIVFAEPKIGAVTIACHIEKYFDEGIKIKDGEEYVVIRDKAHADNLRKALDKAEELGWLK